MGHWNKMIINFNGRKLMFEFGLSGLIYLSKNSYSNENLIEVLYYGLIRKHPYLTSEDLTLISQNLSDEDKQAIKSLITEVPSISDKEIAGWYQQMVGEVGVSPNDFYKMTPEEMDLIYEGYITRKENDANIFLLALRAFKNNEKEILLKEERGYEIGSIEERNQTFKQLNIKEDTNV